MKIALVHLIAISGNIEREVEDLKPENILGFLDAKEQPESNILKVLFNEDQIVKTFFQTREDVPRDEKSAANHQFKKVAALVVKLSLLVEAGKKITDLADSDAGKKLQKRCKRLTDILLRECDAVFKDNTAEIQLFLLRKLMQIHDLNFIKNDKSFNNGFEQKLRALAKIMCKDIAFCQATDNTKLIFSQIARFITQNSKALEGDNLIALFIDSTKSCYVFQGNGLENYLKRFDAITAITASWELVQGNLKLTDLTWLKEVSVNIVSQYSKLPPRYTKVMAGLRRSCQALSDYSVQILGFSWLAGTFWYLHKLVESSVGHLTDMAKDGKALKELLATDNTIDEATRHAITEMLKYGDLFVGKPTEQHIADTEWLANTYKWTAYLVAIIGVPTAIYTTRFALSPSEPRPIPLPAWAKDRMHELANVDEQAVRPEVSELKRATP